MTEHDPNLFAGRGVNRQRTEAQRSDLGACLVGRKWRIKLDFLSALGDPALAGACGILVKAVMEGSAAAFDPSSPGRSLRWDPPRSHRERTRPHRHPTRSWSIRPFPSDRTHAPSHTGPRPADAIPAKLPDPVAYSQTWLRTSLLNRVGALGRENSVASCFLAPFAQSFCPHNSLSLGIGPACNGTRTSRE